MKAYEPINRDPVRNPPATSPLVPRSFPYQGPGQPAARPGIEDPPCNRPRVATADPPAHVRTGPGGLLLTDTTASTGTLSSTRDTPRPAGQSCRDTGHRRRRYRRHCLLRAPQADLEALESLLSEETSLMSGDDDPRDQQIQEVGTASGPLPWRNPNSCFCAGWCAESFSAESNVRQVGNEQRWSPELKGSDCIPATAPPWAFSRRRMRAAGPRVP